MNSIFGLITGTATVFSMGSMQNAKFTFEKYQIGVCFQKESSVGGTYFKIASYLFL